MAVSKKLSGDEIQQHADTLANWKIVDEERLQKTYVFPDFRTALDFVNRIGEAAEEQGHHPDLHLGWGRVDVELSTHDAGGLTEADFRLAAECDRRFSARTGTSG